jgi:hypothetical protein
MPHTEPRQDTDRQHIVGSAVAAVMDATRTQAEFILGLLRRWPNPLVVVDRERECVASIAALSEHWPSAAALRGALAGDGVGLVFDADGTCVWIDGAGAFGHHGLAGCTLEDCAQRLGISGLPGLYDMALYRRGVAEYTWGARRAHASPLRDGRVLVVIA